MYYEESLNLIKESPLDKEAIKRLDREIAHGYAPNSAGVIEWAWLGHKTKLMSSDLTRLLDLYVEKSVVSKRNEVECLCGDKYDPADESCAACGENVSEATELESRSYIIEKQPNIPVYDPNQQPSNPTVFISYRHVDTTKLAADIYYSLKAEGHTVFLDNGIIPVGADAEQVFLRAASRAEYFISLVSPTYYNSPYCKKEIAHAARSGKRIVRINIKPVPDAPNDMTWVNKPKWLNVEGHSDGLTPELEEALINSVVIKPAANNADLREDACVFLLHQLTRQQLITVWNQMGMHKNFGEMSDSNPAAITRILQESTSGKLSELCSALAPN